MTTRPTSWPSPRSSGAPTVRLRDPAGVVAAVPYLLGFVPRRSLVVVGLDDAQGVGATLRADLPTEDLLGAAPPEVLPVVWDHAARVLARNGCTRALVVLYTDTDPADVPGPTARGVLHLVCPPRAGDPDALRGEPDAEDRLGQGAGLDVLDVLLVGPSRFRSLLCPDPACCPADGSPVTSTSCHPVAATFVLAGRTAAPARDDVEPVPPPADPEDVAAAAAAAVRSRASCPGDRAVAPDDRALLEEWVSCLPDGPAPDLAGRLAARWRARPQLRDSCLAVFLPGGAPLARRLLGPDPVPPPTTGAGPSLAASLADPGCSGSVHGGARVLRRMAALVPAPESADVLAAHAWLSWASGEGTAAAVLAERALVVDPGQSLARLVLQCLDHGLGAPWTLRPPVGGAGCGGLRGTG